MKNPSQYFVGEIIFIVLYFWIISGIIRVIFFDKSKNVLDFIYKLLSLDLIVDMIRETIHLFTHGLWEDEEDEKID